MKHVNATGKAVLDALASHVKDPGDSHRMPSKTYMPLVISRLTDKIYSVGQYGEQMGDLMADPEMEFFHGADGEWYPFSYRNDYVGQHKYAVEFDNIGQIAFVRQAMQAGQAGFANMWLKNVKSQFEIKAKRSPARRK